MEQESTKEVLEKSSLEYCYELDTEVDIFYIWLFQNNQKFHRDLIYKYFPELNNIHTNPENLSEEELFLRVKKAVLNFREKFADSIKTFENNIIAELPNISNGIKSLEELMGEEEHFKYLIMPTVYPLCPFNIERNLFYFSMIKVADGDVNFDGLSSTTLHEISHFIFFRQLKQIPNNLSERAIHHLKEVLTPVLLQHESILKHRKLKKVWGNSNSLDYQVERDGKVMSIYDYVNSKFLENSGPDGYMPFLHWLISLFEQIETEVIERDKLFAENGWEVFSKPELNAKFMEPIKLK